MDLYCLILFISLLIDSNFITVHYGFFAATEAIIVLINCIFLFIEILDDDTNTSLSDSPNFIITAGYFFFFSFTCPFYMLYNYIKYSNAIFLRSFYINQRSRLFNLIFFDYKSIFKCQDSYQTNHKPFCNQYIYYISISCIHFHNNVSI